MGSTNLLDTGTKNLDDIFGNGKRYAVPLYQRDYSWKEDDWDDLWNDILSIAGKDHVHYMGSVVLQNKTNKHFDVIDGQQRFSSLTLIILAVINQLKKLVTNGIEIEKNNERVDLLHKKFIGEKDPSSLTYSSKLTLNENNDSFFQTRLITYQHPNEENALSDSEKLLWKAYKSFEHKISEYFSEEQDGEKIANFLNNEIAEKLIFILITVEDELSAYTVFETLNSRGVGLTVSDLLKNYLFSISSNTDRPHIRKLWNDVVSIVGLDSLPTFLRHYWNSKNKLTKKDNLFREIRKSVKSSSEVFSLLHELNENSKLYIALNNYADSFWGNNRKIKSHIQELTLFKEKQAFSFLIAAYNNSSKELFAEILKLVSVITFRYTVISRLHTNRKEAVYNDAALKLSTGSCLTLNQIAQLIKPLYIQDSEFCSSFESKELSTKRGKQVVRYILVNIENHLSGKTEDFEASEATIEHILPESFSDNYQVEFPQSIHESFVYRLGNYTLIESKLNRDCDEKAFSFKKDIYSTSAYNMTSEIHYDSWSPNTLGQRQRKLAKRAKTIWKISQYDN